MGPASAPSSPCISITPVLIADENIRAYCEEKGYELLECHIYPEAESAYNKPLREREQLMKMLDNYLNTLTTVYKSSKLTLKEHLFS